jgi:hypothetical protein
MRADGRTDMTKLIVSLRNFSKAPKNKEHETAIFFPERSVKYM